MNHSLLGEVETHVHTHTSTC